MICFGTFHRLVNVNTSLNSKTLNARKEKRNLFGKDWLMPGSVNLYIISALLVAVLLSYIVSAIIYTPSFIGGFRYVPIPQYLVLNATKLEAEPNFIYLPKYGPWRIYGFICVLLMRIGPLIAIFIMNMMMISKLNNLKLRKRYTRNNGLFSVSRIVSDTDASSSGIKNPNIVKKLSREIKIGKVLILISSTYILFTLPHTIDLTIYMSCLDGGIQGNNTIIHS